MDLTQEDAKKLAKRVGYKGRKDVPIHPFRSGMSLNSYWDSGYRDYFYFVDTKTGQITTIPQNGTPFDGLDLKTDVKRPEQVLIRVGHYGGKQTAAIYV